MEAIIQALVDRLGCLDIFTYYQVSSGVSIFETDKGKFFVKTNGAAFAGEALSLQCIANTHTLNVPKMYCYGERFIVLEYLELKGHTAHSQRTLGEELAKMHLHPAPERFGFEVDNTIGLTPQINTWEEEWLPFFSKHRLAFQFHLIEDLEMRKLGDQLLAKLPQFFEGLRVSPSLLHGDLWRGNTACIPNGAPVVFDPSSYYGHHEVDLSIAGMFGGFTKEFYAAYHALIPKESGFEERLALYQLYHYLNHYTIFGDSYRPACMTILHKFLA